MIQPRELDLASSEFKADPYPAFAHLRACDPVYLYRSSDGQSTWLVTGYAEADLVLRDARFVKDRQRLFSSDEAPPTASAADLMKMTMIDLDPPDHTRLRSLVNPFFTVRQMEARRGRIQAIADELIDAVEGNGKMDLIADFAGPFPMRVISEIVGVPPQDGTMLHQWIKVVADGLGDPRADQQAERALQAVYTYLLALIEQKRQMPAADVISKLLPAEGKEISARELVAMVFLLITAGHDTADNMIGNGMLALLTHPEQMSSLRADPALVKPAVEEFLRYRGPFMLATLRWAREDTELGGKLIRRGDGVVVSVAAANRDEATFAGPQVLDIVRRENHHLAFGRGLYYCLGAPLARLDGEIAFNTLLRRLPHLCLAVDPETLVWRPGWLVQGLEHLPVAFW